MPEISKPAFVLGAALALTAGIIKIAFLDEQDQQRTEKPHEPTNGIQQPAPAERSGNP